MADLKASNSAATHLNQAPTLPPGGYDNDDDEEDEDEENDEEMADPEPTTHEQLQDDQEPIDDSPNSNTGPMQIEEPTPKYSAFYVAPGTPSPYLQPTTTKSQHSPTQPQYSPTYFSPQPVSTAASPNLYPQRPSSERGHDQVDTEVTHALLLLADGSRRSSEANHSSTPERKGRGMSVRDLLSS